MEATAPAEVVTFTPSVGVDVVTVTVFAVVATLAEVVVGDGVQVEDVSTTEAVVTCAAVVVGEVETDSVGALVVVTLVFASAGGDETVFAADEETVATDGVVDVLSDMVGLAALGLFEFESFAVVGVVVAVEGEDVEVGTGEAVGGLAAVAGVDVAVAWAKVTTAGGDAEADRAEAFGKSFTTAGLPGTDLTLVVTAGESLTVFEVTSVAAVIVVSGINVGSALTATADEDAVDEVIAAVVATVVVLAELCPVVFRVVETGGFDPTGVSEAVETTSVGFTTEADVSVPAGSRGVVSVMVVATVTVAAVESVTEDAEETWVDAVSGL